MRNISNRHRLALAWFADRVGQTISWPGPLSDGTLLVTRAKGIYKPAWTGYALSIRENSRSEYSDRPPRTQHGGWVYEYAREGADDELFTNLGMKSCIEDEVPVGVLRQVEWRPSKYRVEGLGRVLARHGGYFTVAGPARVPTD